MLTCIRNQSTTDHESGLLYPLTKGNGIDFTSPTQRSDILTLLNTAARELKLFNGTSKYSLNTI
jgi:hypothetical protein